MMPSVIVPLQSAQAVSVLWPRALRTRAAPAAKEGVNMAKGFTISRVGHIGIQVTNVDRSLQWYSDILGLTLTGR
jgi:catechol-2,3-dioxygenase